MEGHADDRRRSGRSTQPGRVGIERNAENDRSSGLGRVGMECHGLFLLLQNNRLCGDGAMPRPGGAKPRHHTTALVPVESVTQPGASVILYRPSMATSTRHTNGGAAPAIIENYERERVFGLFRQFGYLEAELNPLGLLPPQPHPDLRLITITTTNGRGKRGAFIAAAWAWSSCTSPTPSGGAGFRNASKRNPCRAVDVDINEPARSTC